MAASAELAAKLKNREGHGDVKTMNLSHADQVALNKKLREDRAALVQRAKDLIDSKPDLKVKNDSVAFEIQSDTVIRLRWRLPGQDFFERKLTKKESYSKEKKAALLAETKQDPYRAHRIVYRVEYRTAGVSSFFYGGVFDLPQVCDKMLCSRVVYMKGLEPETKYVVRIGAAILVPFELRTDPAAEDERKKETEQLAMKMKTKRRKSGGIEHIIRPPRPDDSDYEIDPALLQWHYSDMIEAPRATLSAAQVVELEVKRAIAQNERFETQEADTRQRMVAD